VTHEQAGGDRAGESQTDAGRRARDHRHLTLQVADVAEGLAGRL
jgi:hypothetical protein